LFGIGFEIVHNRLLELDGVGAFRVERFNDLRLISLIDNSNVSVSYWSAIGIAWGLSRQAFKVEPLFLWKFRKKSSAFFILNIDLSSEL
jgi:hypothetical protein